MIDIACLVNHGPGGCPGYPHSTPTTAEVRERFVDGFPIDTPVLEGEA